MTSILVYLDLRSNVTVQKAASRGVHARNDAECIIVTVKIKALNNYDKTSYRDIFLLFRVVEIHRIYEATATPYKEGANLSEAANAEQIEQ